MKRLKKPAAWLTAIFLALGLATLGNLSYAAEEPLEAKKDLQAASSSENVAASEEEKPASADRPTETAEVSRQLQRLNQRLPRPQRKRRQIPKTQLQPKFPMKEYLKKNVKMKKTADK